MTRAGTCIQVTPEHELWPIFLYGLSIGVMIMPNSSLIPWGVGQGLAHQRRSAHVTNWTANHRECKPSTWGSEHTGSMEEFSAGSGSWPGSDPRPAGVLTFCKPLVFDSLSEVSSFSLLLISAICPWLLPTWDQLGMPLHWALTELKGRLSASGWYHLHFANEDNWGLQSWTGLLKLSDLCLQRTHLKQIHKHLQGYHILNECKLWFWSHAT